MDSINPDVASAVITAIASVLTTLLGLKLGKNASCSSSAKSLKVQQMKDLYKPLAICLYNMEGKPKETVLEEMEHLIVQNIELVPNQILHELHLAKIDLDYFDTFELAVLSFYNWTKKRLGYPFDRSKIILRYTPTSERNEIARAFLSAMISLTGIVIGVISFAIAIGLDENIPDFVVQICTAICAAGLVALLVWFQQRDSK